MEKVTDSKYIFKHYVQPASTEGKPLVVMFHGTGERGTNLDLVLRYGPLALIKAGHELFDATYVHPQLPSGEWDPLKIRAFATQMADVYGSDMHRLYAMGVSLGGYGLKKSLGLDKVATFAAAVLMSPGGGYWSSTQISNIAASRVPIWIAHAKNDPLSAAKFIVSLNAAQKINAIAKWEQVRLTHYGLSGHSTGTAWGRFMTPDNYYVWDWLKYQAL